MKSKALIDFLFFEQRGLKNDGTTAASLTLRDEIYSARGPD